jgi:hypothetical protein
MKYQPIFNKGQGEESEHRLLAKAAVSRGRQSRPVYTRKQTSTAFELPPPERSMLSN